MRIVSDSVDLTVGVDGANVILRADTDTSEGEAAFRLRFDPAAALELARNLTLIADALIAAKRGDDDK